jgi:hypothetical protein
MRRIEHRHARSATGEDVSGPSTGGPCTDDGNVGAHGDPAIRIALIYPHYAATLRGRTNASMVDADVGRFTVGVFQDAAWAAKGLDALKQAGFPHESMTIMTKDTPEAAALIERVLGASADRLDLPGIGSVIARGPLVDTLQGAALDLTKRGLASTMGRVGFQPHDGRIFETLTGRGGVLVAIRSEPRAADALAILHSYGGGNAAIGAWTGRL